MKFARRKAASTVDPASSPLGRELRRCATRRATGEITMNIRGRHDREVTARIHTFEGGVYAASVDGFIPRYRQRLISGRVGQDPAPEILAGTHQENLLALVGQLLHIDAERVDAIAFHDGTVTDTGCTLPIEWTTLLTIVQMRHDRAGEDFEAIGLSGNSIQDAASLTVQRASVDQLANAVAPEFEAFFRFLTQDPAPLDEVAHAAGFTRAEALHLVRLLGPTAVHVTTGPVAPDRGVLVAEAACA